MTTIDLTTEQDLHAVQWNYGGGGGPVAYSSIDGADFCLVVNTPDGGRAEARVGDTLTITGNTATVSKTATQEGLW